MSFIKTIADLLLPPAFTIVDKLEELSLQPVKFDKTTVNAQSLMNLQRLTNTQNRWTHVYGNSPAMAAIQEAFQDLVEEQNEFIDEFNFMLLQSFTASKGFTTSCKKTNAKKYENALDWGRNMWEAENLAFSTSTDFENNIAHLKREGIGARNEINVDYYDWHDRYCWANSGGSHHAAALIRQIVDQNRKFSCPAKLTTYRLNPAVLQKIRCNFHLLIAYDKCKDSAPEFYLSFFLSNLQFEISTLKFPGYHQHDLSIYVIPKSQKNGLGKAIGKWVDQQLDKENFVCFFDFVSNPQKYLV